MARVTRRVPSMAEREEAAIRLGKLKPGEKMSPQLQTQMAAIVQKAHDLDAADAAAEINTADFATPIAATYGALIEGGLPEHAAARVVAAIAPAVWRTNQGAAHARNR